MDKYFDIVKTLTDNKYKSKVYFLANLILPGFIYLYLQNPELLLKGNFLNISPLFLIYSIPQYIIIRWSFIGFQRDFKDYKFQNKDFERKFEVQNNKIQILLKLWDGRLKKKDNNNEISQIEEAYIFSEKAQVELNKLSDIRKSQDDEFQYRIESSVELGILMLLLCILPFIKILNLNIVTTDINNHDRIILIYVLYYILIIGFKIVKEFIVFCKESINKKLRHPS